MPDNIRLKKYSNRRLYDTEKSRYVTLEQVSEMIKQGKNIEVIDAKTQEPVTSFILVQIILEETKKHAMLPVSLLHLIIRYGDNVLTDFFQTYLEETLKIYLNSRATFDAYFRQWLEMGMNFSGMNPAAGTNPMDFASVLQVFEPNNTAKDQDQEREPDRETKSGEGT